MPGDGNCALHAILDQLQISTSAPSDESDHPYKSSTSNTSLSVLDNIKDLRQNAVSYLRQDKASQLAIQDSLIKCQYSDLTKYLESQGKDGEWVDEPMLRALAEYLQREIKIYHHNGHCTELIPTKKNTATPIHLGQIGEEHYVSLLQVKETVLTEPDEAEGNFQHSDSSCPLATTSSTRGTETDCVVEELNINDCGAVHFQTDSGSVSSVSLPPKPHNSSTLQFQLAQEQSEPSSASSSETANQLKSADFCFYIDLGTISSGPAQPLLPAFPKRSIGGHMRSFHHGLYKPYSFIEYSVVADAVFCYPCRIYPSNSGNRDPSFITKGNRDWKNIHHKLAKHSRTQVHIECQSKWHCFLNSAKQGSVLSQLSSQHKKAVEENRQYIQKVIEILLLLCRQGLAFRGHDETLLSGNRGNFLELCSFLSKYDAQFASKLKVYHNLTSPDVQNEIIHIAAKNVVRTVVRQVKEAGFYCLLADEARSFKTEQLAICLRYVTPDLQIKERFLMFVDCSDSRDAEGIAQCLLKSLEDVGLKSIPIVAQAYDGASVMSGRENGVQRKIREIFPMAFYVHCMSHRFNLIVVDMCKVNRCITAFFGVLEALYVFFSRPGVHKTFVNTQGLLGLKAIELTQLSDTRWACRWRNVNAVKTCFKSLLTCLTELSSPESRCFVEAQGLLHQMRKIEFLVCLAVFDKILALVHVVHEALQAKGTTIATAHTMITGTIAAIRKMRSDENDWKALWSQVENLRREAGTEDLSESAASSSIKGEPEIPQRRPRKVPRMADFVIFSTCGQREIIDSACPSYPLATGTARMAQRESELEVWKKQIYLPVADALVVEMQHRFMDNETLDLVRSVSATFNFDLDGIDHLLHLYGKSLNFNADLVKTEMQIMKAAVSDLSADHVDVFSLEKVGLSTNFLVKLPNLFKLMQLAFTLPVSSSTCERSFSAMRRVKNYMRATMGQERFSDVSILAIESDLSSKLVASELMDEFANCKQRKMKLF